jgi:PD-(D/E)XK nuclease superfamily
MRHGLAHQLPVYLAYARALTPAPPAISAVLYFLRNDFAVVQAPPWEEIRDDWAASLSGWLRLAEAGAFPPLPHHVFPFAGRPAPRYCDACPFKDHCRVSPAYDGSESDPAAIASLSAREPILRPVADHRAGKD